MKRLFTSLALLGALALLAGVASGASGHRASSAQSLRAATATFQDTTGEDPNEADISTITVSSDDAGLLTFQITIANRPTFTPDMALMAVFDTDADPSTGSSELMGAEYVLEADGAADGGTTVSVVHWNGAAFSGRKTYPNALSYANGVATITINRTELGGTGKFDFWVGTVAGIDPVNDPNMNNIVEDDAPDQGVYAFDTGLQPIEQPVQTATKLLAAETVLAPTKPKVGSRVMFGVGVETDIGSVPAAATVTCTATAGKKVLKAKLRVFAVGLAACAWVVPKGTKGKMLRGTLTVRAEGLKLTKTFAARIR